MRHPNWQGILNLLSGIQLHILNTLLGNRTEGFFWPRKEPVDCTLVEKCREFSGSFSELVSNWREAKNNVKIISESVEEIVVNLSIGWFLVILESFDELSSDIRQPNFFFVFWNQTWNFSCTQNHVDVLEETFLFNLSICQ